MRLVSRLLALVVLVAVAGCGGKSGPADIKQATAEQERQLQDKQQEVNTQERQRVVTGGKPLTREDQVNMDERRQRGR